VIDAIGLTRSFGGHPVVQDVTFSVAPGEVAGFLGPNGAGKSTTVHLSVGLLAPDSGRVEIGRFGSPSQPATRARIGVAPQGLSLYDLLTGEENLTFFARVYGLTGARLAERVKWALDFVGLTERRTHRVETYSGGMKRRLNLAAAVLHDPDLLLLDEPTVGVDPQSRNHLFDNILALKQAGKSIVYTTHYMEEAARLCDRVAIMDRGTLLAQDTVPGLLAAHGGRPVLVIETTSASASPTGAPHDDYREQRVETDDPLAALNRVAAELAGSPTRISGFRVERATLEQVFLHLTGRTLRD
jgi:ABC-2 type transport system ATP-binding protein